MTQNTRPATIHDIVRRLTNSLYRSTAETALVGGMGYVDDIKDALDDAIEAGYVEVVSVRDTTYGKGVRFVALAEGVRYCQTCLTGCDHGTDSREGCGCLGCWSPNATSDCPGRMYAELEMAAAPIA